MAKPNPFRADAQFFILPIRYQNLRVGRYTEQEFLSRKKPKDARNWHEIKHRVVDIFMNRFLDVTRGLPIQYKGKPQPRDFVIVPTVSFMQPGFFAFISRPSEIELRIRIVKGRDILDEVIFRSQTSPTGKTYYKKGNVSIYAGGNQLSAMIPTKASVASRIQTDARYLADGFAKYLRWRLKQK